MHYRLRTKIKSQSNKRTVAITNIWASRLLSRVFCFIWPVSSKLFPKNPQSSRTLFTLGLILPLLVACGGTGDEEEASYTRVPIAYLKRMDTALSTPINAVTFTPGGDLYIRSSSDTDSEEINITASETNGTGDVSGLDVSLDGERLLFSMKRNSEESWNIWEYQVNTETLAPVLIDNDGDDLEAKYLFDGSIVFTSNRQERRRALLANAGIEPFDVAGEYGIETVMSLHVMSAEGTDVRQISFSPSHERTPAPLNNGRILFSRWDHFGAKNRYHLYSINKDGTDLRIEYGAFSSGNSRLFASQMDNGKVITSLLPINEDGGALYLLDLANYTEAEKPDPAEFSLSALNSGNLNGQQEATAIAVPVVKKQSDSGRYRDAYPLFDGSNRALVSFTFTNTDAVTSPVTGRTDPDGQETGRSYMIAMVDLNTGANRPIVLPEDGRALVSPVALLPRSIETQSAERNSEGDTSTAPDTIDLSLLPGVEPTSGVVHVWSVYDTDADNLARLSNQSLTVNDPPIPTIAPTDSKDPRNEIADLVTLKTYDETQRAARYVRVIKSIPQPLGLSQNQLGLTPHEMQQILGYGTIESDGSFAFEVPSDTPFTLQVLDDEGRSIAPHYGWLQVRPGETLSCKGCHSPRRGDAINTATIRVSHGSTSQPETQAETRSRVQNAPTSNLGLQLTADIEFWDFWIHGDRATAIANSGFSSVTYDNLVGVYGSTPSESFQILSKLDNGIINYAEHIQPIWDATRGALDPSTNKGVNTCSGCHSEANSEGPAAGLDLTNTLEASGRLRSYDELMSGVITFDSNDQLRLNTFESHNAPRRDKRLVFPGSSRQSFLTEVLYDQDINANGVGESLVNTETNEDGDEVEIVRFDHSTLLTDSEYRLVNEWLDLGAQYYNELYQSDAGSDINNGYTYTTDEFNGAALALSESTFENSIHTILMSQCFSCHQPIGSKDVDPTEGSSSADPSGVLEELNAYNNFVLTGSAAEDFNSVARFVSTKNNADANALLARPSYTGGRETLVHPLVTTGESPAAILPTDSNAYNTIRSWIEE